MIRIIIKVIALSAICIASDQEMFFINHLVEKNGAYFRPITNEPVIGEVYRYFGHDRSNHTEFVGTIDKEGKNGTWTRWWENGVKKSKGSYVNSVKHGFWTEWKKDGNKYAEMLYKNGKIIQLKNCETENCNEIMEQ